MGGRVTRSSQSRELVRADLRQAVEAGASPGFIAPSIPATAQHSPLSWNRLDQNSEQNAENNSAAVAGQGSPDLQRQFLEQLFENSPDALLIIDPSFRTLCVNREFERLFVTSYRRHA